MREVPSLADLTALPQATITPLDSINGAFVYTPAQIRAAYGVNRLPYDGAGQTIALVEAYDDPNIFHDTAIFDQNFGLPGQSVAAVAGFLKKVNEWGQSTHLPRGNVNWAFETALDVEWAHAIAPKATILLVEANSNSGADLLTAVNTARNTPGVVAVSMSWGVGEFASETIFNSYFTTPAGHIGGSGLKGGITFVASSGDKGAWKGPEWPAVVPSVLGVGGSSLFASNGYGSETGWKGSGGGYSKYEPEPAYQQKVQHLGVRSSPDVAYDANPNTGFFVYNTYHLPAGYTGWYQMGGTSAGAPQWAALIALADQARATAGRGSLDQAQKAIYGLPHSDFHSITKGYNGYSAHAGYNLVTGLGTPYADRIVNDLMFVPGDPGYTALHASTTTQVSGIKPGAAWSPIPGSDQGLPTSSGDLLGSGTFMTGEVPLAVRIIEMAKSGQSSEPAGHIATPNQAFASSEEHYAPTLEDSTGTPNSSLSGRLTGEAREKRVWSDWLWNSPPGWFEATT